MTEAEEMRKYAEAHGCEELRMPELTDEQLKRLREEMERQPVHIEPDSPVRPLPCVRDERGETNEQTIKQLLAKIDEELNELKAGVFAIGNLDDTPNETPTGFFPFIAEEAADTITAITTMLEALGIDAEMRDEAQRRVNAKNRNRNRL